MDQVSKFNVYVGADLIASYDNQAPATSYAKLVHRRHLGKTISVVEEVFAHVSSQPVRYIIDGKIHKCT